MLTPRRYEENAKTDPSARATSIENIMNNNLRGVESLTIKFLFFCAAVIICYSAAIAILASQTLSASLHNLLSGTGSYLAVLAASVAVGGFLGFLFGIPRLLQGLQHTAPVAIALADGGMTNRTADNAMSAPLSRFAGNTNLEDISDWLTKIIVGLSLVQAGNIYSGFLGAQSRFVNFAMDNAMGSGAMFAAMVLSGLVAGFLFFYLETRTRLTILLASADHFERNLVTDRRTLEVVIEATNKDAILDEVRITPASPDVGKPTEADRQIAAIPFSELRTVDELAIWGAAQERLGNTANAEKAFRAAVKLDINNPKLSLALASINKRRGENDEAAKVLNDVAQRFSDDPAVLKETLLTALYVPPPTGYTTAIAAAERLVKNFPEAAADPHVQLWIAAANGQKFRASSDEAEKAAARREALAAVIKVNELAPDPASPVRKQLRKIFDPQAEHSAISENDLEIFKQDPEFSGLIETAVPAQDAKPADQ